MTEMDLQLFKNSFEKAPMAFYILRLENPEDPGSLRQLHVNDAANAVTRINLKKNNGKLWKEAYPELAGSELATLFARVAVTGEPADYAVEYGDSQFPDTCWTGSAWCIDEHTVAISFTDGTNKMEVKRTKNREYAAIEKRATKNKHDLETVSEELMAFTYSVSHDLRAPLRRLDGFSQELLNEYSDRLDETGRHYLQRIRNSAQNMGNLIDDLLKLSRISRKQITREMVDLGMISLEIINELKELEPDRNVTFKNIEPLQAHADKGLARVLLLNLLSNAWKFSSCRQTADIEFGSTQLNGDRVFYVKDNGTGFDMKYADKLFRAFQRLHSEKEYEGSGIGLATVSRIINLHNGKVWAESKPGTGSTFYFSFNLN